MSTHYDRLQLGAQALWILDVPLTPPSVNHYLQRRRVGGYCLTKEAQAYKDAVILLARAQRRTIEAERYIVDLFVYLNEAQQGDLDNFPKLILDGLAAAGVISNDKHVQDLYLHKRRDAENPRTRIVVYPASEVLC